MNTQEAFEHGDQVRTEHGHPGSIIDVRDASDGTTIFGVLNSTTKIVTYYTADGLRHAVPQTVHNITF